MKHKVMKPRTEGLRIETTNISEAELERLRKVEAVAKQIAESQWLEPVKWIQMLRDVLQGSSGCDREGQ